MKMIIEKQTELLSKIREETNELSRSIYTYCEVAGTLPPKALLDSTIYLLKLAAFCNNEMKRLALRQPEAPRVEPRELVDSLS